MKRILISRLSSLGDVVCSLPVAVALKQAFPEARITWAVDPRFAGMVRCCASVDETWEVKPGFSPKTWPTFAEGFDLAIDLQGLLKSAWVVARASAPIKLGYHWQREGSWLFSSKVLPDASSIHIVDQYVDVARAAGANVDKAEFNIIPAETDQESSRILRNEFGLDDGYIILNAGAGWATKRWPPSHFALLIAELGRQGRTCALIGGRAVADTETAQMVISECEKIGAVGPVNLLGKTSVGELVALIAGASVHVGGDTGSSHIAAALGRPAIGLYSITKPARSCPYGQIARCHFAATSLADIAPERVIESTLEAICA